MTSEAQHPGEAAADQDSGRGLEKLIDVLETHHVRYWIDSGVLLGLWRDGGLVPWEKDLDLAVQQEEVPKVLRIIPALEALGYRVNVSRYRRSVYALSLVPRDPGSSNLRAGLHVYYACKGFLWSPQPQMYVPPPAPDVYPRRRSAIGTLLRWSMERWVYSRSSHAGRTTRAPDATSPVTALARRTFQRLDHGRLAETWPIREVFVPLTWLVPENLVLPLGEVTTGERRYPVPARTPEYLDYRYGDWRTPVSDWCYWVDDRSIVRRRPSQTLELLRSGWVPRAASNGE
jgi:hypothetical protein